MSNSIDIGIKDCVTLSITLIWKIHNQLTITAFLSIWSGSHWGGRKVHVQPFVDEVKAGEWIPCE